MPWSAPKHCPHGHPPFSGSRCPGCSAAYRAKSEASRPSARRRGYTGEWEAKSRAFLALPENRLCACGCGQRAEVVDHKVAHKGDAARFWDVTNWQPMTRACNSRKAVREEGGFGRRLTDQGRGASEFAGRTPGPSGESRAQSPRK